MKRFFLILAPALTILILVVAVPFAITHAEVSIFENPIKSKNLAELIQSVVDQLFPFAITIVSFWIIYVGFKIVKAMISGNASALKDAKDSITNALIGAAIVAGSKAIVEAVKLFAEGFK